MACLHCKHGGNDRIIKTMTLWRLNILTPPLLRHSRLPHESSDVEGLLPDMTRRIQVKPVSTKPAHRENVFREIQTALNISGFLWDNKTRLKLCLNVLVIASLIAAHVYLLKCAVNYETLDFVLYGTRIVASSATCFVTALSNERHRRVIEALNEDANNTLPRRRVTRIRTLCRVLTGVSLMIVLGFFTPPTYITFFTNNRTTAPLFKRCLMYTEDLLFVLAIWYQLCFLPSLFVMVSHTIRELLSAHNDSLPRLFSRPVDSIISSPLPPLCHQLTHRQSTQGQDSQDLSRMSKPVRSLPFLLVRHDVPGILRRAECLHAPGRIVGAALLQDPQLRPQLAHLLGCLPGGKLCVRRRSQDVGESCRRPVFGFRPPSTPRILPESLRCSRKTSRRISLAFTIAGFYKLTLKAAFSVFSCMLTYAFVWYQIGPANHAEGT
ncbi:hypothetical protein MTO96_008917 [Rhipicephalus appendiculatus]